VPVEFERLDLRQRVAAKLLNRRTSIVSDTVGLFPFSGDQPLDADYCQRLGTILLSLLADAVDRGDADGRSRLVIALERLVAERGVSIPRLFALTYLTERTALDDLALDAEIGVSSEDWPLAAQLIRRASFDVLAAYAGRLQAEASAGLHPPSVMMAALDKELRRAERGALRLAFMILEVDRFAEIVREHGPGVAGRVLERFGVLVQKYFRRHDWIARHGDSSVAVLLIDVTAKDATALAERLRRAVETRLPFRIQRAGNRVPVTMSGAVVTIRGKPREAVDADRVLLEAHQGLKRAKERGGNRIVHGKL
jgi:diguanylate cyclase (GGDEF)-like protein